MYVQFRYNKAASVIPLHNCGQMTKILQITAESNERARFPKVIPKLPSAVKVHDFEGCLLKH